MKTQKNAFTMIELIFVIVIIGILSAVALPKFIGVSRGATAQKIVAFVGTMNRTTLPSMYLGQYQSGGSIKTLDLNDYITIPTEINTIDLTACTNATFTQVATTSIGAVIYCRDGNSSNPPKFAFATDGNTSLDKSYFQ